MCAGCVGGAGGLLDAGGWQARVDQCDGSRTMAERRDRPPSVAVYRPVDHDVSTVWGGREKKLATQQEHIHGSYW